MAKLSPWIVVTFLAWTGLLLGATAGSLRGVPTFPLGEQEQPEQSDDSTRHSLIHPEIRTETATFINPSVKALPIDYCLSYSDMTGPEKRGIDCGTPAANYFCREKGYKMSTGFICMYYSHGATYVMGLDDINPASDKTLGLGFHTFFSNISCAA